MIADHVVEQQEAKASTENPEKVMTTEAKMLTDATNQVSQNKDVKETKVTTMPNNVTMKDTEAEQVSGKSLQDLEKELQALENEYGEYGEDKAPENEKVVGEATVARATPVGKKTGTDATVMTEPEKGSTRMPTKSPMAGYRRSNNMQSKGEFTYPRYNERSTDVRIVYSLW